MFQVLNLYLNIVIIKTYHSNSALIILDVIAIDNKAAIN